MRVLNEIFHHRGGLNGDDAAEWRETDLTWQIKGAIGATYVIQTKLVSLLYLFKETDADVLFVGHCCNTATSSKFHLVGSKV